MKESRFIEQNKKNWSEFESSLRSKKNKAAKLSRLFIQITDDLSYARTFYKFRSVKVYLNGIAQVLFNDLYRNQTSNFKKFIKFWKTDLPLIIHEARIEFRISFAVFVIAFAIGIISSIYDKQFPNLILGENYIQQTLENIRNNDPMAVYKHGNSFTMFFYIAVNNLFVALRTFAFGLLAGIGAIFALLYNGIMVGAFQYFFIERGLFLESFLTIWQHGTLEISMIIIAGAAGITLGKGLLFPGTFLRMEAFKLSAMRGLKIFLGISPVIILAAFIEGFLTRHTEIVLPVRLLVILISLCFVLFYFVWYPWYISRMEKAKHFATEKLSYKAPVTFNFTKILTAEEILGYTLNFFKQKALWIFVFAVCISIAHAIMGIIANVLQGGDEYAEVIYSQVPGFRFNHMHHVYIGFFSLTILMIMVVLNVKKALQHKVSEKDCRKATFSLVVSSFFASVIIFLPFLAATWLGVLSILFLSPMVFFFVYHSFDERLFFFRVWSGSFSLLGGSWSKLFWNNIKIVFLLFLGYLLLDSGLVYQYIQTILMNFNLERETVGMIWMFLYTIILFFLVAIFFIVQITTSVFTYYASKELVFARNLQKRIDVFGERNVMFGFEREL